MPDHSENPESEAEHLNLINPEHQTLGIYWLV